LRGLWNFRRVPENRASATVGNPWEIAKFLAGNGRDFTVIEVALLKLLEFDVVNPQVSEGGKTREKEVLEIEKKSWLRTRILPLTCSASGKLSKIASLLLFL